MDNIDTLKFKPMMKEAWRLTKGMKGKIWLLMLFLGVLSIIFNLIGYLVQKSYPELLLKPYMIISTNAISCLLMAPFYVGYYMISAARARGEPISYWTWTKYSKYFLSVSIVLLIMYTINGLPALINPISSHNPSSIYDIIAAPIIAFFTYFFFGFAVYIIVDKKVNPFQACWLSIKLIINNFKICVLVYLFLILIIILSVILLLIPYIWTVPYACLLWALLYVRITEPEK